MRYLPVFAGLFLLVGALVGVKYLQIAQLMAFGAEAEAAGPPPEAVGTTLAVRQSWERSLAAVGTVTSLASVAIRNEVPGVVRRIAFESGSMADAGQVLVELDAREERSQLAAAEARRRLTSSDLERTRNLVQQGALARSQLDEDEAAHEVAVRDVAALQAQLAKKVIRAPFAGRLGIRAVNSGQLLEAGTVITVLDAVGGVFVDFAVPQEELDRLEPGQLVEVALREEGGASIRGSIAALAPTVDRATRNLQIRARLEASDDRLRPGMFVDVSVVMPERMDVVAVPATALVRASYGDSVFVVVDKEPGSPGLQQMPDGRPIHIARQQFVRTGETRGDFVAILQGLAGGETVVTAGAFKLRNGSPVVVDDASQPAPSLDPRPENR